MSSVEEARKVIENANVETMACVRQAFRDLTEALDALSTAAGALVPLDAATLDTKTACEAVGKLANAQYRPRLEAVLFPPVETVEREAA